MTNCFYAREINTKITLSWALKQFVTWVHTLFSMYNILTSLVLRYEVHMNFIRTACKFIWINLMSFHMKFMKSSFELQTEFIWTSQEFHMNEFDFISYKIRKKIIWTSYEARMKFWNKSLCSSNKFHMKLWIYGFKWTSYQWASRSIVPFDLIEYDLLLGYKNIEKHTAHTIVLWARVYIVFMLFLIFTRFTRNSIKLDNWMVILSRNDTMGNLTILSPKTCLKWARLILTDRSLWVQKSSP